MSWLPQPLGGALIPRSKANRAKVPRYRSRAGRLARETKEPRCFTLAERLPLVLLDRKALKHPQTVLRALLGLPSSFNGSTEGSDDLWAKHNVPQSACVRARDLSHQGLFSRTRFVRTEQNDHDGGHGIRMVPAICVISCGMMRGKSLDENLSSNALSAPLRSSACSASSIAQGRPREGDTLSV